ncbi:MAG TPA: hypothetical protein LFV92_02465 [Rickettsia endosymbiont of Ceroptres masudai]|nr:hypothetical protein [Rickettsia endosymbiont of Ceroptres masudai]
MSVIPENKPAIKFWRNTINAFTKGNYQEDTKLTSIRDYKAERVVLEFNTDI